MTTNGISLYNDKLLELRDALDRVGRHWWIGWSLVVDIVIWVTAVALEWLRVAPVIAGLLATIGVVFTTALLLVILLSLFYRTL
jgi:hypothetical protein